MSNLSTNGDSLVITYKHQLEQKQQRVAELTSELESILTQLPLIQKVVSALEALEGVSSLEPVVASAEEEIDPAELLAKAQGIREKLTELKQ